MTDKVAGPDGSAFSEELGAGSEARRCPACGDYKAHRVQRMECNSCGSLMYEDWDRIPSTPIETLLAQYAEECSDFSGRDGYEFALRLARQYAAHGPDSQMRCVVHTLLANMGAPNVRAKPDTTAGEET